MIKLLNSTSFLVSLLFVSSTASAVACTPATINPSAIARIVPHSSIGTVMAAMGCVPTEQAYSPIANATIYRFKIPMVDVFVDVVVDSQGVVFAEYIDFTNPIAGSYNGALRVNIPPLWVPSAGTILSR